MSTVQFPKTVELAADFYLKNLPAQITNLKWAGNDNMDGWIAQVPGNQISKEFALQIKKMCELDDKRYDSLYADGVSHIYINDQGDMYLHIKA